MEEEIKYHAYYDSLTNLPNRVLLKDRLEQGLTYSKNHESRFAVLFMDLDRFKASMTHLVIVVGICCSFLWQNDSLAVYLKVPQRRGKAVTSSSSFYQ